LPAAPNSAACASRRLVVATTSPANSCGCCNGAQDGFQTVAIIEAMGVGIQSLSKRPESKIQQDEEGYKESKLRTVFMAPVTLSRTYSYMRRSDKQMGSLRVCRAAETMSS
jgi:hypothetical protein